MGWGKNVYKCGCYNTLMVLSEDKGPTPVFVYCKKHGKQARLGLEVIEGKKK